MRLSELLDKVVVDTSGRRLGQVRDVHLVQDGPMRASGQAALRVHGIVVGRHAFATRLGYESRAGVEPARETRGPLLVRALVRWLHRRAVYVPYDHIQAIGDDVLVRSQPRAR